MKAYATLRKRRRDEAVRHVDAKVVKEEKRGERNSCSRGWDLYEVLRIDFGRLSRATAFTFVKPLYAVSAK